jgi:hypothetical protein
MTNYIIIVAAFIGLLSHIANAAQAPAGVPDKATPPADFSMAMVLRSTNTLPNQDNFLVSMKKLMPKSSVKVSSYKDTLIEINVDGTVLSVGLIDAPYPAKALEDAIKGSRLFPNAAEVLKLHKSHLVVFLSDFKGPMINKAMLLTMVVAALCDDPASLAISWAVPTFLIKPSLFKELASISSVDDPPIYLWIDIRIGKNQDGTFGGYTRGMNAFGFKDYEFRSTKKQPKELTDLFSMFILYLFEKGDVIKDGDTIGLTAEQIIKVRFEDSKIQPGKTVYSLSD